MPMTINGVICGELVKDYSESCTGGKSSANKSFICYWPQRFQLANGLIGYSGGTRAGGTIFIPPARHPDIPSIVGRSVTIKPVGMPYTGPNQSAWESAIVSVEYGALEWPAIASDDAAGDQAIDPATKFLYCTQSITYGLETYTVPGSALVYTRPGMGGSIPFNQNKTIRVGHAELNLTFNKLPYIPVNFMPFIDNVNDQVFLGGKIGTVKFNGGSTNREYESDGTITQSVNMSFSYRPQHPWNTIPDPSGNGGSVWVNFSYKNGDLVFPKNNLSAIFPSGYAY